MTFLLGFLLVVGAGIIIFYNKLVKLRNLVKEAWSSIDVMLKKRHDLIPGLVETVKGYATHEKDTLQSVIEARNQAVRSGGSAADAGAAESQLSGMLGRLFALAESYPDLKANTNFLEFQRELSSIEGDIEKSRRYYNGTVRNYNTTIESFPGNVIAGFFSFVKESYFEMENLSDRNVPEIKF